MDPLSVSVALVVVASALLYLYATRHFSFWKNHGVPFVKPYPLVGSMLPIFSQREHIGEFFKRIAEENPNEPYVGYFQIGTPGLIVMDPEVIKNMMVKDFSHFTDHGFEIDEQLDPLQARNLVNMDGQRWKEMRSKLTPTFTSGKMKNMFPLVEECTLNFINFIGKRQNENLEMKDLMARFTTDIIASCAFGISINSIENPKHPFRSMGRKIFDVDIVQALKNASLFFMPIIAKTFRFSFFKKEVSTFFRALVMDIIEKRIKTGNTRKDFMQLLIQLKERGRLIEDEDDGEVDADTHTNYKLDNDDIVAQAMVFFVGGFETSSTMLSYAMMEMARAPHVQQKAKENISEVLQRHSGIMSYQAMHEMTYLDWIVNESLRMYPPFGQLHRVATQDYKIPKTNITLKKGTPLVIPIRALQNDPKYFEDPHVFNPDRFADEEMCRKNQFSFLPFGEGPRHCIGMRFAKMQSKMALYAILNNFEIKESPETVYPPRIDPKQFMLTSIDDIYVKLKAL